MNCSGRSVADPREDEYSASPLLPPPVSRLASPSPPYSGIISTTWRSRRNPVDVSSARPSPLLYSDETHFPGAVLEREQVSVPTHRWCFMSRRVGTFSRSRIRIRSERGITTSGKYKGQEGSKGGANPGRVEIAGRSRVSEIGDIAFAEAITRVPTVV